MNKWAPLILLATLLSACVSPPRPPVVRKPPRPEPAPAEPRQPQAVQPARRQAPPPPPAEPAVPMRTVVAVQTCLDRNNFSCGCIDGELTEKTVSALKAWQTARGLPATGEVDEPTLRRVGNLEAEFGTVEVTREMISALTPYPTSWRDKAAMRRLNYSTVLEAVAEKGHASEDLIQRLNPGVAWPDPPAGTMLVVPKVWPARYVAAARLVLSLSRKEIQAFDSGGKMVAQFPCSIARDVSKRPVGDLAVVNAASDPVYTFDPSLFAEDAEAATISGRLLIPAGPNNPVGVAWVGLSKPGYGIHGTPRPEDIGKTESHGCFRLANWNAAKLVKMIKVGAPVRVEE